MLFDPSFVDRSLDAGAGPAWQSPGIAAARDRASPCVLTLPDFASEVPREATIQWRADTQLDAIVLEQFRHGPLRASDVEDPKSPADAFQQAFFAWVKRFMPQPLRFISMGLELCDTNAVLDRIEYQHDRQEFEPKSPLHLGVRLSDEWVHEIGVLAQPLREAHPLLLYTLFATVDRVSGKTVMIRTPGWFLCEMACQHWEGDESATDEEARAWLDEWYGGDEDMIERYLPSVLRPLVCPDKIRCPPKVDGRRIRSAELSATELRDLASRSSGMASAVCRELVALRQLLGKAGKRPLLDDGYDARPLYSGCTFVLETSERIGEFLDDHMNMEYQAGETTEFSRFLTFSTSKQGIRAQYAQWGLAFQMLRHLDRLMALVVSP
ncbi:PRTRC system protein F [Paraburkholderia oxyphila]|uniref:PRTRC system protein F n=1 Tax=Paraburkholderia oxyphila TaxID=614212 RepID=UPI000486C76C|nr:PRTRC system protein F [Paraburkholderia oxyphila]